MTVYGLDYDGVIADTNKIKSALIKELWKIEISPFLTDKTSIIKNKTLNPEQYESLIETAMGEKHSLLAQEVPGAREALKALSKKGKVHIITARTLERSKYAKEWLKKHELLDYITDFHCTDEGRISSKEKVCKELGINILVDDDEGQLTNINSKTLKLILFKDGATNKPKPQTNIKIARNWEEAIDLIE